MKQRVAETVKEGDPKLAGLPVLVVDEHGYETGDAVESVEEVILKRCQAAIVHWDLQAPGEQGDEDRHGERQVL